MRVAFRCPDGLYLMGPDLCTFHGVSLHLEGFKKISMSHSRQFSRVLIIFGAFNLHLESCFGPFRCVSIHYVPPCALVLPIMNFLGVSLDVFSAFYDQINSCSGLFLYVAGVYMFVDAHSCVIMRLKRFRNLLDVSQQQSSRLSVFEIRFTSCRACSLISLRVHEIWLPRCRACECTFVCVHVIQVPTLFSDTGSPCTLLLCVASVQYVIVCRS